MLKEREREREKAGQTRKKERGEVGERTREEGGMSACVLEGYVTRNWVWVSVSFSVFFFFILIFVGWKSGNELKKMCIMKIGQRGNISLCIYHRE